MKAGDKIWLKQNRVEGWPRQAGVYVGFDAKHGIHIVEVQPDRRRDPTDDGLREVSADQIDVPRDDAGWNDAINSARCLVAKGYSTDIPRWKVREHLRGLLREAIDENNDTRLDQVTFLLDEWNQKN